MALNLKLDSFKDTDMKKEKIERTSIWKVGIIVENSFERSKQKEGVCYEKYQNNLDALYKIE